jgi:23S rRNA (cytosine1962-C5)-methyltransferase
VYRDGLASVEGAHGDIVRVTYQGRTLGSAFLSTRSKIALRWIERSEEPRDPTAAFWRERLEKALEKRSQVASKTNAFRVVHDSADGFPGLIVDRYERVAVLETTIAGADRLLPVFVDEIRALLGVEAMLLQNDLAVREKEGLSRETRVLWGEWPGRLWVHEEGPSGRIEFPVDAMEGQKTGAFLDQRENRWRAGELATGRVLDAFSYQGLFALHSARRASEVTAVDTSEAALRSCEEAAARNQMENIRCLQENVFDYLKEACARGERFDRVILDPPAFAKSRGDLPAAVRGYREINRRAMELLPLGGILVTCSCSYNLTEWDFLEVLREAANDARSELRILERRTQAADHPILLCFPESAYLKCAILEKVS